MTPELRELFPISKRKIYLNHAAVSPPPTTAIQAIEAQLRDVRENGTLNYRSWLSVKEHTRQLLASFLGARPEQVAFMRNTSDSLSTVANGMKWKPDDNIVTFSREFPSNVYPWLRLVEEYGVEVRMADEVDGRVHMDELESLVDNNTRLISISHVQYASGFKADLERLGRLARKFDALFVVDTIQSLGVVPIVESELIDVAAGACHKWLLTPEGVGYLYLSDRARERVEPTLVGWVSVPNPEDYFNFEQGWNCGTLAWETGTAPTSLMHGLRVSLELLQNVGTKTIASHLENLTDQLCEQVQSKDYEILSSRVANEKSQIVSLRHPAGLDPMKLYVHLRDRNIVTAPRGDGLRVSPHLYNTADEIEEFVDALP